MSSFTKMSYSCEAWIALISNKYEHCCTQIRQESGCLGSQFKRNNWATVCIRILWIIAYLTPRVQNIFKYTMRRKPSQIPWTPHFAVPSQICLLILESMILCCWLGCAFVLLALLCLPACVDISLHHPRQSIRVVYLFTLYLISKPYTMFLV